MNEPNTQSSPTDTNTLLALGAASVFIIGGLVYYFTSNNKSENTKPLNQEDLNELTKNSEDSGKNKRKNNKKKNVVSIEKNNEENEIYII